jgi:acetyl esterase/lipase
MTTTDAAASPTRPPFDAELAASLYLFDTPPMNVDTLPQMRAMMTDSDLPALGADVTAGGALVESELTVPGPDGAPDITLLVVTPATGTGPWPVIYNIHGGGMTVGHRRMGVELFTPIAAEHGVVVVSVEYRLAPEHPHPAPIEDCYAGLAWIAHNAEQLGIDPERIIVAGASAGGGLAAGTALMARDRGFPQLTHQVLICPMLDDRMQTPSSHEIAGDAFETQTKSESQNQRPSLLFCWDALLGPDRGGPDVSPYAAPARATDLSGLPHTYIDVGNAESFRDEVLDYAHRLSTAGVVVDLHMWGGAFHGFDYAVPHAALSRAASGTRHEFLVRALEWRPRLG